MSGLYFHHVCGDTVPAPPEITVTKERVPIRPSRWYALWRMTLLEENLNVSLWVDLIFIN
jgi:hypothetical protein